MNLHPSRVLSVCLATLMLGAALLCADEPASLFLKDGRALIGSVEEFSDDVLIWNGSDGKHQEIPLADVERLEFPAKTDGEERPANSDGDTDKPDSDAETSGDTTEPVPDSPEPEVESVQALEPIAEDKRDLRDDPVLSLIEPLIGGVCGAFGGECESALTGMAMWTQRLELGLRFRDGNSEEDFINVGSKMERKDDTRMMSFDFGGQYAKANGVPAENRWFGNTTVDMSREGNWILFLSNRNEFDEFENLDYRGTVATGLGYRFYNESDRRLVMRLGPGVTHQKFHDPKTTQTTPDMFGEVEFRWPLFDRTEIEHKSTVTPSLEDVQVFRLQSNYGIVVRLDEKQRWSLKLGLQHQYNSRPNLNNRPSDYTTGVRLLYQLK